jgi:hypothetical protein
MIIETAEYNAKLIGIFIKWYWIEMPYRIILKIIQYTVVLGKIFSFSFLIKTFFAPWKNQLYAYPSKGFDMKHIFEVWTSNTVSRIVGAFVRGFTIILGIAVVMIAIFVGSICLIIWVLYPVLFVFFIINSLQ